jgi:hypothetical protein
MSSAAPWPTSLPHGGCEIAPDPLYGLMAQGLLHAQRDAQAVGSFLE